MSRLRTLLWAALSSPRAALLVVGAGLLLTLPSLSNGLAVDDHFQRATVCGYGALTRAPWDQYRFVPGEGDEQRALVERGLFPWFTSPGVKLVFFRPLASLSVYADYALLPFVPWLFHLESVGALGLVALLIGSLATGEVPPARSAVWIRRG